MSSADQRQILVTGATGFIGGALVPALLAGGEQVIAATRRPSVPTRDEAGVEWRTCDVLRPETLPGALEGVAVAYYLVHTIGRKSRDRKGRSYQEDDARAAESFAAAAARAGLERIVYLGGPAPARSPSTHLRSRLAVGEILRGGPVPTLELRASMVIGAGSASWRIVRDLALRLPVMVLPAWLRSRSRPVAIEDVLAALLAARSLPLATSEWFDLPGPETLSGREILERVAALHGRRLVAVDVPLLTPRLSALWLRLVTRASYPLARELVLGLAEDLLPRDDRYWSLCGHTERVPFDEAARRALRQEPASRGLARAEEQLVEAIGPRLPAAR